MPEKYNAKTDAVNRFKVPEPFYLPLSLRPRLGVVQRRQGHRGR